MELLRTSEWVSPKHPDKMCDRISDAILDAYLTLDKNARVAVETMGGHGAVYICGEVTTEQGISSNLIREIVERISGVKSVVINIVEQSPEIANGVDTGGAGDQGIMNGYAVRGNKDMLPMEMYYARSLGQFLYEKYPYDGKTQVTMRNGQIDTIVASFQNSEKEDLKECIITWYANQGIEIVPPFTIHANPAGDWNQGGFDADTGLTGRKLAVDNYGASIPVGGGAFSGKDPSKVDRSAAYMARQIAVEVLENDPEAQEVNVQLAYAIGVAEPVQAYAEIMKNNGNIYNVDLRELPKGYDLTPNGIIEYLDLKKPRYEELATNGHFTDKPIKR